MTIPVLFVPMVQSMDTLNTGPPSGYFAIRSDSSHCFARTATFEARLDRDARRVDGVATREPRKTEDALSAEAAILRAWLDGGRESASARGRMKSADGC
eukprot:31426-Pelagococcus_subviridis.AAC.2